ncbi:MAG: hypothetical protein KBT70_03280 [Roseovarius sp.]|uniref:hypothetical protein n=1 Tax=Roseovarius sp. TaxID=1486281 RepID=UPI001B78444B|nr:hypothetical protein [Roseovarius sp.]MBQ0749200.1 hypothetical protein [Roseovarius sp.]MBQ0810087.1 hypothetical protein [Roseovarius sp.]
MDDVKTEKTPTTTYTTVNRTVEKQSGSGATLWFLLGGIVVVVAVIAYFMFGEGVPTPQSSAPTSGNVSVTVETDKDPDSAAAPTEAAPAETAPVGAEPEVAPQSE